MPLQTTMDSRLQSDRPFPHGTVFGGYDDIRTKTGLVRIKWECTFELEAGNWHAIYMGEMDMKTDIRATGDTPRQAFESLVNRFIILNGGVETPTMSVLLPQMRAELDAFGLTQ